MWFKWWHRSCTWRTSIHVYPPMTSRLYLIVTLLVMMETRLQFGWWRDEWRARHSLSFHVNTPNIQASFFVRTITYAFFCLLAIATAQQAMELANGFLVRDKPLVINYGQGKKGPRLDAREQNEWWELKYTVHCIFWHCIQTTYFILTLPWLEEKAYYFTMMMLTVLFNTHCIYAKFCLTTFCNDTISNGPCGSQAWISWHMHHCPSIQ